LRISKIFLPSVTFVALLLGGCAAYQSHRDGMSALERDDFATAIAGLRRATELSPDNLEYRRDWLLQREAITAKLLVKANSALAQNRQQVAESYYRTILAYDSTNARARMGIGSIQSLTQTTADIEAARKAIKAGEFAKAERLVSQSLERHPDFNEALQLKSELDARRPTEIMSESTLGVMYKKPINLEFRDAPLKLVFDALSRTTGINFIFDKDVKADQKTTVFLKQTSLEDSIDVILATNQLDKKILNAGSVLIFPNTPAKIKEYQDLVVRAFYLSNVEAKSAATMLKTVLKLKEIYVDERYNMLILREPADTILLAEKLISLHDLEEPEVMLEVAILEVNRSNLLNLGIQFSDQLTISPLGGIRSSGAATTSSSTSTLTINELRGLNSDLLGITAPTATVNLQMRDGDAKLLANPRLRVRDREKSKILIGDKVPVVTTTATPNGFLSESIQYLDVGLKLEAEPVIRINGDVGLKVSLEVSSIVGIVKTNNGSQAYQIGTRNYSSALRLRDGETQIIAGLISDEDRSTANRIPLIGKLPLIGRLFSSQSDSRQKTEIVMSITPRLVRVTQRKDPRFETFWSGTENSLRIKPLQLRAAEAPQAANIPNRSDTTSNPIRASLDIGTKDNSKAKLYWEGPSDANTGSEVTITLAFNVDEAIRALPIQLGFDPNAIEIISVTEGGYFTASGKGTFGHVVDKSSGRISAALSTTTPMGAKGDGKLLVIKAKIIGGSSETEITVLGATPVGVGPLSSRLNTPIVHLIRILPK
jgi:general secretion pathway protein D